MSPARGSANAPTQTVQPAHSTTRATSPIGAPTPLPTRGTYPLFLLPFYLERAGGDGIEWNASPGISWRIRPVHFRPRGYARRTRDVRAPSPPSAPTRRWRLSPPG